MTPEGKWLVFGQPKYAVGLLLHDNSYAPIGWCLVLSFIITCNVTAVDGVMHMCMAGGYIDANEDPLTAAKRELLEECGYTSNRWIALSSGVADANRGCGVGHLFLAVDAVFEKNV